MEETWANNKAVVDQDGNTVTCMQLYRPAKLVKWLDVSVASRTAGPIHLLQANKTLNRAIPAVDDMVKNFVKNGQPNYGKYTD